MVDKIKGISLFRRKLKYHENKVLQKKATCIHAANFLLHADQLTFHEKASRFEHLYELNQRAEQKTSHISISLHPDDRPDREKWTQIADDYMKRFGFENQPYLVYQHFDSAHPHIHILAAAIGLDGKRLITYLELEERIAITKATEQANGLIEAKPVRNSRKLKPILQPSQSIDYGKVMAFDAISNTLEYVLPAYNFTSLLELNALLRQYNLRADNGKVGGFIRANNGLVYRILDERGIEKGLPIKSSAIDFNPGLVYLKQRFLENEERSLSGLDRITSRLELAMRSEIGNWQEFEDALRLARIQAIPYANEKGMFYRLAFIDHQTRTVASDLRLGHTYSACALLERLGYDEQLRRPPVAQVLEHPADLTLIHRTGRSEVLKERNQRTISRDINRAAEMIEKEKSATRQPDRNRTRQAEHNQDRGR